MRPHVRPPAMPSRAHPFVAFSLAFTTSLIAQGDPAPAPSLLPLHEDARWTYDVERNAERGRIPAKESSEVVDEGGFTLPDGERVHQLRVSGGRAGTFEGWSVRQDGVFLHSYLRPEQRGGLLVGAAPIRVVALPLGHAATWEWEGPLAGVEGGTPCMWKHRATLVAAAEEVTVPAGTFRAVHVKIVSEYGGISHERELWFAPGTGVVRDERRRGAQHEIRVLKEYRAGHDTRRDALLAHLDEQLKNPRKPPFNMTPFVVWVDGAPEAMLLPGRIAVVKAETWSGCYYVDGDRVFAFDLRTKEGTWQAATAAFGTPNTAVPPDWMPLRSLALLLARAHAEQCDLGHVRPTEPTLQPERALPQHGRTEHVEVIGGANDGTTRRVAVWLTFDRSAVIQIVSDAVPPRTLR